MNDVRSKVLAALDFLEGEGRVPSIASVCRLAEVNRSNLYVSHPEIVQEIRKRWGKQPKRVKETKRPAESPLLKIARLKDEIELLAYTCLELRVALDTEREKNVSLLNRLKRAKLI